MPRNSSGTYSLPAGNPVVSNTLIQSTWANTTLSDVSTAMTDSLDRNGRGAMLAALKNIDGTAVAPSITFSSEGTLGIYRPSAGVLGFAAGGALVLSIAAAGLTFTNPIILPIGSATAPSLTFVANTNTGVYSPATNQVAVATNGAQRLLIDATGNLTAATGILTFTTGQRVTFAAPGANLVTALDAAGTLGFQTGGANTRLSIDAAGTVTVAGNSTLTGAVGVGGTLALGKLQVFGGAIVIDNAQGYAAKSSGGTLTNLAGLDASNNLLHGSGAAVATQQFSTGGTTRLTIDATGNVGFRTTPSAWGTLTAIEGTSGALGFNGTTAAYWMQNLYFNGAAWTYKTTAAGSVLTQFGGSYQFNITPSGTAGAAATLTSAMVLDASGNLLVGSAGGAALFNFAGRGVVEAHGTGSALFGFVIGGSALGYALHDGTTLSITNAANGPTSFATNGATRMTITSTGVIQDGAGNELGYKGIPNNVGGYVNGQCFVVTAGFTLGGLAAGNCISCYNNSASAITITQGAITLRQGGTANTGNRTLLARGFATIWFLSSSEAIINGNIT